MDNLKKCGMCERYKKLGEFYKNKAKSCGYDYKCILCAKKAKMDTIKKNQETKKAMFNHLRPNIESFPRYYITAEGVVINVETAKILKPSGSPYLQVSLTNDFGMKRLLLHRLLAAAFIPNPEGKETVNHKDGNKKNNTLHNLEWATCKENVQHAFRTGLAVGIPKPKGEGNPRSLYVHCKTLDGVSVKVFKGANQAVIEGYATHKSHVNACCSGKRKSHNKYLWVRESNPERL